MEPQRPAEAGKRAGEGSGPAEHVGESEGRVGRGEHDVAVGDYLEAAAVRVAVAGCYDGLFADAARQACEAGGGVVETEAGVVGVGRDEFLALWTGGLMGVVVGVSGVEKRGLEALVPLRSIPAEKAWAPAPVITPTSLRDGAVSKEFLSIVWV